MFGLRGWPLLWPVQRRAVGGAYNPRRCYGALARFIILIGLLAMVMQASAALYMTHDPADVSPTESVYPSILTPYFEGLTPSGIRYKVVVDEGEQWYSSRYTQAQTAVRNSLRIEFDRPVAAVGAQLLVAGFDQGIDTSEDQASGASIYVSASGYRGVVANNGGLREVTFISGSGPISVSRIDVRPMPVAVEDSIDVYENSQRAFEAGSILGNDLSADGAILVSPPLHAAYFELHEDGSFIYRPAKDYHGVDSILYRATNGGGATISEPATVTFHVLPVNCPPTFVEGSDIVCHEDDGAQTISQWARAIRSGPDTEGPQGLSWEISTNNDALFAEKPTLNSQGDLSFEPAGHASGEAQVVVRLHDDGGTDNGGQDTSAAQAFKITVLPKEYAPALEAIPDCVVRQGDALVMRAKASEVNVDTGVVYSLDQAPEGASIDSVSGQIVWRPSEADAGGLFPFVVRATETAASQFSSTVSFKVEVVDAAKPPVVPSIPDIETSPGNPVRLKVGSSTTAARFFLASPAAGATLDPDSGNFLWTPKAADAGKLYQFAVSVVDPRSPGLCTVRTFNVLVGTQIVRLPNKHFLAKARGLETAGQAAMMIRLAASGQTRP